MKKSLILLFLSLFIFTLNIQSQISNLIQQRKTALVIGNGSYLTSELANPENDARAIKNALQQVGFDVIEYENLTQSQMKKAIDEFGLKLKSYDVGLFYYAGHGIQFNGYNYLIPVDAKITTEKQIEYDCVQADRILALMEGSGTKVNIIILDACRNNPFERSWTRSESGKGLAFMNAPKGTLIAYATSPGSTASDGSGRNGLYTSAILESIQIPKITILQMFQQVRTIVSQKSNDKQTPWESTSMTGDFYFNTGESVSLGIQKNVSDTSIIEKSILDDVDYIIDSRDRQRYKTVKIGNQVWMAENLKTIKFNDDTPIPLATNQASWSNLSTPAYCWYDNNEVTYKEKFGTLYNWYTVKTGKLCPLGWHIPSDDDWSNLEQYLGGENVAGAKMKEPGISHWDAPNKAATNESGFLGLPGGYRGNNGKFSDVGKNGRWWSSSENYKGLAWSRNLEYNTSKVRKGNFGFISYGYSVRCVKD